LISFRYHLVSIVAVFFALALGVLVGTTVVNQGVIDDLSRRTDEAVQRTHALQAQIDKLQGDVSVWKQFGDGVQPLMVAGQLSGDQVVIVTQDGVDASEVDGVNRVLQDAGANLTGVLSVTARMALSDDGAVSDMAQLLGQEVPASPADSSGTASPSTANLAGLAAQVLAQRLVIGPPADLPTSDVLQVFLAKRFLALRGGLGSVADIGGAGEAVVLLTGGHEDALIDPSIFLMPLAEDLASSLTPVVAGETADTHYPFVPLLRGDDAVDGRVVTVDNADSVPGRVAIVLGLRNLLETPGAGGDYGVKDGASGLIPKP
jgi:hypothetical protein